jgi:hypothetical protein
MVVSGQFYVTVTLPRSIQRGSLGGSQNLSGRFREKNPLFLSGTKPPVILYKTASYRFNLNCSSMWWIFTEIQKTVRSHDRSVGVATRYGLSGRGSIPGGAKIFFSIPQIQIGPGAHIASYRIDIGGPFPLG